MKTRKKKRKKIALKSLKLPIILLGPLVRMKRMLDRSGLRRAKMLRMR